MGFSSLRSSFKQEPLTFTSPLGISLNFFCGTFAALLFLLQPHEFGAETRGLGGVVTRDRTLQIELEILDMLPTRSLCLFAVEYVDQEVGYHENGKDDKMNCQENRPASVFPNFWDVWIISTT